MSDTEKVRAFYEGRVGDFAEPRMRIGGDGPLHSLVGPEDCEPVPAAVFEAVGFYFVNVLEQDNGSVFVFRADAGGVFTYGVLATTDGSSSHLEVYARDGTLLAAGIPDWKAGTIAWKEQDKVRRHAAMWG
ncbi:MAG TPA: hypothetical protein VE999_14805 [Gemmataceae bacterium]|nr:hypothetical protein [Gemmataceae bacterium]